MELVLVLPAPIPSRRASWKKGVICCLSLLKKWGGAPDLAGFLLFFIRATDFDKATSFSTVSASVDFKSSPGFSHLGEALGAVLGP